MTDYEIIMIFLEFLSILFIHGSLIIAILSFLDKRNDERKKLQQKWSRYGSILDLISGKLGR